MSSVDTLVIGSGIAGLFTALRASELGTVTLVTKDVLEEGNTRYAQGGIAAAIFSDDDVALHVADTIAAGAGLCNEEAVSILCSEGPSRIADLLEIGVAFDRAGVELARGLEAAHSRARVLHAGGDATGAYIEAALCNALHQRGIVVLEHTFLTDLIVECGDVVGAEFLSRDNVCFAIRASATVLACGGAGQVYRRTTNPKVATGDGVAAALRAGAIIADAEFFQFHPTVLATRETFLVSEAVRGEGAVLRNIDGHRFMLDVHPAGELAPRDVVARAITEQMEAQGGIPIFLDATSLGADLLASRFPRIDRHCRDRGLDWSTCPIPVTPAAHYWMGGVATDTWGRTSLPGLLACGEVACSGVHGANRLASNSLLEGIVFGDRIGRVLRDGAPDVADVVGSDSESLTISDSGLGWPARPITQGLMWRYAGLSRDSSGLHDASAVLGGEATSSAPSTTLECEDRNLATCARLIVHAALLRTESRGASQRSDYPDQRSGWNHHTRIKADVASALREVV